MTIKDRTYEFIKDKGLKVSQFETMCGLSNGYVSSMRKGYGEDKLNNVLKMFPDLNREWLLYGEGNMYKVQSTPAFGTLAAAIDSPISGSVAAAILGGVHNNVKESTPTYKKGIPYYEDIPVTAGESFGINAETSPSGYIDIPGITASYLFPVIGFSMKPEINPGDIIGVVEMESFDIIDPDKTYMIVTTSDRMVKHLAIDDDDHDILWAISPNYPKFKILKSEIKRIFRVTFCGKIM